MSLSILFSTGEVSGDMIGAMLARELKAIHPDISIWGAGGGKMRDAGVRILVDSNPLGSVGITEPFVTLPGVFKAFSLICANVRQERPDAAVLIGHEVFNLLLARWLKRNGILTIAYFPPQTWIWGKAAGLISRCYDCILTSFIEEHEVYRRAGSRVVFVGHFLRDLVEEVSADGRRAARHSLGLDLDRTTVGVLPGSRLQEIKRLGPVFLDAVAQMVTRDSSLQFVLPVADPCLEGDILQMIRQHRLERSICLCRDSKRSIAASDLVILCSGTATLEAALMGVPMVILYRVSQITIMVVRMLVRTRIMDSETAGLPNLLAGESIVVELRQAEANASRLTDEAWSLLTDSDKQIRAKEKLRPLKTLLGEGGVTERVAKKILEEVTRSFKPLELKNP
jgi:lipid-A-disaccharide synthase